MKESCVILADEHPHMLEGVRGILEAEFGSVLMVANRRSLISTIKRAPPDLVVVDISLPETDGVNIARVLINEIPDLKIIVLSLYDDPDTARIVMGAGAKGFVLKRAAGEDLPIAARAVLEGKTFVSPSIQLPEISKQD